MKASVVRGLARERVAALIEVDLAESDSVLLSDGPDGPLSTFEQRVMAEAVARILTGLRSGSLERLPSPPATPTEEDPPCPATSSS